MIKALRQTTQGTTQGDKVAGPHEDLRGDLSGLRGDLDKCGITTEDRQAGINIVDLIGDR